MPERSFRNADIGGASTTDRRVVMSELYAGPRGVASSTSVSTAVVRQEFSAMQNRCMRERLYQATQHARFLKSRNGTARVMRGRRHRPAFIASPPAKTPRCLLICKFHVRIDPNIKFRARVQPMPLAKHKRAPQTARSRRKAGEPSVNLKRKNGALKRDVRQRSRRVGAARSGAAPKRRPTARGVGAADRDGRGTAARRGNRAWPPVSGDGQDGMSVSVLAVDDKSRCRRPVPPTQAAIR